jgi:hypothetical protein
MTKGKETDMSKEDNDETRRKAKKTENKVQ